MRRRQILRFSATAAGLLTLAACGQAAPPPTPIVITATPEPKPAATPTPAEAAKPTAEAPKPAESKPAEAAKPAGETKPGVLKPTDGSLATPASAPTGARTGKNEVAALYFASGPQGFTGGTSKVVVTVEKNTSGREIRVAFSESEVGGSGAQWRAAGWLGVVMSGLLLGVDPAEYRYTFDTAGRVDGPSAGALITAATAATLLGHTIKPDVSMTGTINPDGTIGPVGGIPQKLDGAAKDKKKMILIPAGQRQSLDMASKQPVDVIAKGRQLGVDVREVSDIYEAYELLTGKPLPKPPGMKEVRPSLPGASFERTRAKAKEWLTRTIQLQKQYEALPEAVRSDQFNTIVSDGIKQAVKADSLLQQGAPSGAYNRAFNATLMASIGYQVAKVVEMLITSGFEAAIKHLEATSTVTLKIDSLVDRLETQQAASLGDIVSIAQAYGNATLAIGLASMADQTLNRPINNQDEQLIALTEATLYFVLADHLVELAKDAIDIGLGLGKGVIPSQAKIEGLAELFRRAAEANLNYFESITINEVAQEAGLSPGVVKATFSSREPNYAMAVSSIEAMQALKKRAGTGLPGAYATFGGAMQSYTRSSSLVAKYYSLDATIDGSSGVIAIGNEQALINMLDFAEKRAKESIGLAVSVNAEPVHPVIAYEGAKIDREGTLDDKFKALEGFWLAALQSQVLGTLSGQATLVK